MDIKGQKRAGKSLKYIVLSVLFLILGFQAISQLPVVTVRFANPKYDQEANTYCLDVEFQSNMANQKLFGMNVRFFYDDKILEFKSFGNFAAGYGPTNPNPPVITTGNDKSGPNLFGFEGPAEFVNGAIQSLRTTSLTLPTSGWTRLFTISFEVDDPKANDSGKINRSIVWDLKEDPAEGGFLVGDEGVVITLVASSPGQSQPAIENVIQFK